MFVIPNSSAMDATASSGGPGTFVYTIATGSPEQIAALVSRRLHQAEQFLQLIGQLRDAAQQLEKVWTGGASQTAIQKITDTLSAFEKVSAVIRSSAALLGTSGSLVETAQTAYTTVVSAVNPTVSALMSNPWTHSAAVALSTSTSAALRGFISGIGALLKALGGGDLAQQITSLVQIIGEVEQLIQGGTESAGSSVPAPSTSTPVTPLVTPPKVASSVGEQVAAAGGDPVVESGLNSFAGRSQAAQSGSGSFTDYTPSALAGFPANGAAGGRYPWEQVGSGSDNSWIPVDPMPSASSDYSAASGYPASSDYPASSAPSQHEVTVTTTGHGVTTTVTVPTDQAADFTLTESVDGHEVTEHISVSAAGKVSVT